MEAAARSVMHKCAFAERAELEGGGKLPEWLGFEECADHVTAPSLPLRQLSEGTPAKCVAATQWQTATRIEIKAEVAALEEAGSVRFSAKRREAMTSRVGT